MGEGLEEREEIAGGGLAGEVVAVDGGEGDRVQGGGVHPAEVVPHQILHHAVGELALLGRRRGTGG